MKAQQVALLLALGSVLWLLGTLCYANYGRAILETTGPRYWFVLAASAIASAAVCVVILWWRDLPSANWATGMLLLALPGMIGEVVVLSNLPTFMPKLHATSGGKYAALLFGAYALALALAEVVTLGKMP
jgi:Family of unknown function (DUF5367)